MINNDQVNEVESVLQKKENICRVHGHFSTLKKPCPRCILERFNQGGGTPISQELIDFINANKQIPWYEATIQYWTRRAEEAPIVR